MVNELSDNFPNIENDCGEKFGEIYICNNKLKCLCVKCPNFFFEEISLLEDHIFKQHAKDFDIALKLYKYETTNEIVEKFPLSNKNSNNFKNKSHENLKEHSLSDMDSITNEDNNFFSEIEILESQDVKSEPEPIDNSNLIQKLEIVEVPTSKQNVEEIEVSVIKKRYPCSHCNKTYAKRKNQKDHIASHLGLNQLFKCEQCGACLKSSTTLKSHMRIHTGERPFQCTLCPRSFRASPGLLNHMIVHSGEKKFSCSFCGKRFQTKAHVQIHERIHTGEKPFQCDECGEKFACSSRLTEHNKRHKNLRPFTCDLCKKSFFSNQQMLLHKVVHTNEKNFKCKICSASFGRKRSLKQHEKSHSNSKDYKCKICNEGFFRYSAIYYHMKSKHKFAPFAYNYTPVGSRGRK